MLYVLSNDSDPNLDSLQLVGTTAPAHGSRDCSADGRCRYTPVPGYVGPDQFDYTVSDGTLTDIGTVFISGDMPQAVREARLAVAEAEKAGDPERQVAYRSLLAVQEGHAGLPFRLDELRRGAVVEDPLRRGAASGPPYWFASALARTDQLDAARAQGRELLRKAESQGDPREQGGVLSLLSRVELSAGSVAEAARLADAVEELVDQSGPDWWTRHLAHVKARVLAHRGEVEEARRLAERGLAPPAPDLLTELRYRAILGFVALSLDEWDEAATQLVAVVDSARQAGYFDPSEFAVAADAAEALIGAGRHEAAAALLDELEELGGRLDSPRALATAARGRGLLAADAGELESAVDWLERALAEHDRLPVPFERARTLLALGRVQRRAKLRLPARDSLERAIALFDHLDAPLWAAKARAEVARTGGRRRAGAELTPTEDQVAELVAAGHSNKEVAAQLFVTPKTVEAHLSRIYAKLGVRSRTQLTGRLAGR